MSFVNYVTVCERAARLQRAQPMLRAMGGKGKLRLHLLRGYGCMLAVL